MTLMCLRGDSLWSRLPVPFVLLTLLLDPARAGDDHAADDLFWQQAASLLPAWNGVPPAPGPSNQDGSWGPVIAWPHIPVSAATLPNGKLLTYAGQERTSWPGGKTQTYWTIFDPSTNQFDEGLYLQHEMFCAHLVVRKDGVVQTVGGRYTIEHSSLYDWRTNTWSRASDLHDKRWYTTSVALPDGDVFTVAGNGGPNTAERFETGIGQWRRLNGINWQPVSGAAGFESQWWPYLWVAPDGRLFHFGPTEQMHWVSVDGNGARTSAGLVVPNNHYPKHAGVTMYDSGKILVAGGAANTGGGSTNICYTIDLNTDPPTVQQAASMNHARRFCSAMVLPTGEVMVCGGNTSGQKFSDAGTVLIPEIWNPATNTWRTVAAMTVPRNYHSVGLLLPDGRVFMGGSGYNAGNANHQDGQIYSPPSLFTSNGTPATRPVISAAPDAVDCGAVFELDATPGMHRFTASRLIATTHGLSTDQRFLSLPFSETAAGKYQLVTHPNQNVMVPGYWMVFAVDGNGAYSESHIIHITDGVLEEEANGNGLLGEYHDGITLADKKAERVDPTVNFNWGNGGPYPEVGNDGYSERWTGWVMPEHTETYTFFTNSDDGVRLWVDGNLLIDNWTLHAPTEDSGTIALTAGQPVTIKLEHFESGGGSLIELRWSSTSVPKSIVPQGSLFSTEPDPISTEPTLDFATVAVDDQHELYLNGQLIGIGTERDRAYHRILGDIQGGATLAIRASSSAGAAFAIGEFKIGGQSLVTDSSWKVSTTAPAGWNQPGFDDSSWAAATDHGGLPTGVSGFSNGSAARQIWAADLNEGEVFIRVRVGPPVIAPVVDREDPANTAVTQALSVSTTGTGLSFSATGLPVGLGINAGSGVISGTPTTPGVYASTVTATDSHGSTNVSFLWTIVSEQTPNQPPVATNPGNQAHTVGASVDFVFQATDPENDPLTYGALGLPEGLIMEPTTGRVFGAPTAAGSYNVQFTVADAEWTVTADFAWTVNEEVSFTLDPTSPQESGGAISFSPTISGGTGMTYSWNFGDGSGDTAFSPSAAVSHPFAQPGRYRVTLTAQDGTTGVTSSTSFIQNVHPALTANAPKVSQSVVFEERPEGDRVWNVNPDNDTVSVFDAETGLREAELAVGDDPRALTVGDSFVWVSNKGSATLSKIDRSTLQVVAQVPLLAGSKPHGIIFDPARQSVFVVLEGSGELVELHASTHAEQGRLALGDNPRHLSQTADGATLYVTRFITPPVPGEDSATPNASGVGGEVLEVDADALSLDRTITLRHSDEPDSGGGGRGIPNYLGPAVISPAGAMAWVPSKQDNIFRGMLRDGRDLNHENTVRAISSRIVLSSGSEDYLARIDHDDAAVPSTAVWGPNGLYLFVALEGNGMVAVVDVYGQQELFRFATGFAPQGLAISPDGHTLFVHNFLSRSVSAHAIEFVVEQGEESVPLVGTWNTVSNEALTPTVLTGKRLFYDAADGRLARDSYISCAACHNAGEQDGRVWDLTGFGEGLRNTIGLNGHGGTAHGPLHWSANFDEVQDFENQIRSLSSGTGLIVPGNPHPPLDPQPNAGRSTDLDALAAYVSSLTNFGQSPHRQTGGELSVEAQAGKAVFEAANCASCHAGSRFTDSAPGLRHDVGTLSSHSGQRLGGVLDGLDTPTLRGLWETAPYLHDGSAATLREAVTAHTAGAPGVAIAALSSTELDELVAYLSEIDDREGPFSEIVVDGDLSDWPAHFVQNDPDDIAGATNLLDVRELHLHSENNRLYVGYRNDGPVTYNWGYALYVDVDGRTETGLSMYDLGADYLIQDNQLARYIGDGTSWAWEAVENFAPGVVGDTIELSVTLAALGNPQQLQILFVGDNAAYTGGSGEDLVPDTPPQAAAQQVIAFDPSTNSGSVIDLGSADVDGDGLPDAWEYAHGLNPSDPADALLDADGDGMSAIVEWLRGLDPATPNVAELALEFEEGTPGTFHPRVLYTRGATIPGGTTFVLEHASDPDGPWSTLNGSTSETVQGPVLTIANQDPAGFSPSGSNGPTSAFYRLVLSGSSNGQEWSYQSPVSGFIRVQCPTGSDTRLGPVFRKRAVAMSRIAGVQNDSSLRRLTVEGTPPWTTNQFSAHVIQFVTGALAGRTYPVHSNTETMAAYAVPEGETGPLPAEGDAFVIAPAWTLSGFIGTADSFTDSTDFLGIHRGHEVLSFARRGAPKSAAEAVYYRVPSGWRATVDALSNRSNDLLRSDAAVIVRGSGPLAISDAWITLAGTLQPTALHLPSVQQTSDFALAVPLSKERPLRDLGLIASGAFEASANAAPLQRKDELLVYPRDVLGINKNPRRYFYDQSAGRWRNHDAPAIDAGDDLLPVGAAVVIRKVPGSPAGYWQP